MNVPVWQNVPVLLVPKYFVRRDPAYEAGDYYNNRVLEFLRAEALNAGSALVRTLKNRQRVVLNKDLKREFPYSKRFLFEFSREHDLPGLFGPVIIGERRSPSLFHPSRL